MKKIYLAIVCLLIVNVLFSQAPQRFNYQAVLRGSNGQVLTNKSVKIQLSFLSGSETGLSLYAEEHPVTTNGFGLINVEAGGGTFVSGSFPSINWSAGNIWLKIDIDENLTGTYTSLGSAKLLSVPYALFASSGNIGPQGPQGEEGNGILNIEDNGDGTLTFNFTKSLSYTTTNLKGQEGDQGDQGIPGPKGDQGNEGPKGLTGDKGDPGTGLSNRGNWVTGTTYNPAEYVFALNTAQTANSMWIVKASTAFVSNNEPRLDLTNWVEFQAPQGPLGPQGIQGVQGPQGIQGPVGPLVAGASGQTLRNNGATWIANDNIFNNGTNVGIGTTLPTQKLDINGSLRVRGNIFDADNLIGDNGQILYKAASGIKWQNPTFVNIGISGIAGQVAMWSTANSIQGLANVTWSSSSLQVASSGTALPDDPIFEVKNKDGKVVFGVYQGGVRVYVEDTQTKGAKGGFAVGGLSQTKAGNQPFYFKITPDTARIYINDSNTPKGAKGGFAVGGMSQTKAGGYSEYLRITPDSARININEPPTKGAKGGFAVGGLSQTKGTANNFMQLTPDNYFIGHQSGSKTVVTLTTGLYNSFLGYQAGMANTDGNSNAFIGYKAGLNNTIGSYNVFIGNESGTSNIKGVNNVFLGYLTGYANTGSYNVFLGSESGKSNTKGYNNAFIGYLAGQANTLGRNNVFIGTSSGFGNLSGDNNVFLGNQSGYINTTGDYNTFIGFNSGYTSNASYNSFIGYQAGKANTSGTYNSFLGYNAGLTNTTGASNVFIGNQAGNLNSTGSSNVFLGNTAGYNNTASNNVFLGFESGYANTSGTTDAFMGYGAGRSNTTGSANVFLGNLSGYTNTTGGSNVAIGDQAGYTNSTGSFNVMLGFKAGYASTLSFNTFLGYQAGTANSTGQYNSFMGYNAGLANTTGANNVFIGNESGKTNTTGASNVFLGFNAGYTNNASFNTFIGYQAGRANAGGEYNSFFGYNAGLSNTSGGSNVFIGYQAGSANTGGLNNVFIGKNAGQSSQGNNNILIGFEAGKVNAGNDNIFIGLYAGANLTLGTNNLLIGTTAGYNHTTQEYNLMLGSGAGYSLNSLGNSGSYNSFMGINAGNKIQSSKENAFIGTNAGAMLEGGWSNTIVGICAAEGGAWDPTLYHGYITERNTILGCKAGQIIDVGSDNIFIGYQAGAGLTNVSNKLYIGSSPLINSVPLIYGDFSSGRIGLGTITPSQKLQVVGNGIFNNAFIGEIITGYAGFAHSSFATSTGYALLQSSDGLNTYLNKKAGAGNIYFRVENADKMYMDNNGNFGIGTTGALTKKLQVAGDASVTGNITAGTVNATTFTGAVTGNVTGNITGSAGNIGGVTMGKINLVGDGVIAFVGLHSLERSGNNILVRNNTGSWSHVWWQGQQGTTFVGNAFAVAGGGTPTIITLSPPTNSWGYEIHFGDVDGGTAYCSVWIQYSQGRLVGYFIK